MTLLGVGRRWEPPPQAPPASGAPLMVMPGEAGRSVPTASAATVLRTLRADLALGSSVPAASQAPTSVSPDAPSKVAPRSPPVTTSWRRPAGNDLPVLGVDCAPADWGPLVGDNARALAHNLIARELSEMLRILGW
uniref:Uncharacterized protein n=1 Tax=Leersia perrieri TaxID=77586 RepID=A0A0D9XSR2_9ORYZ